MKKHKNTSNTEAHMATDERIHIEDLKAYAEGVASRLRPETKDAAPAKEENADLADA